MRKIALALPFMICSCSLLLGGDPKKNFSREENLQTFPKGATYRDYNQEPIAEDIAAMRFILKSLSQKSLVWLWGHESELESYGDQINHIHPLKFLESIFIRDEFIVYVKNIKNRGGFVWDEFVSGFEKSFEEERRNGNLLEEQFLQFVFVVRIDSNLIEKKFRKGDWEGFMKILITNIERDGEPDRYDQ